MKIVNFFPLLTNNDDTSDEGLFRKLSAFKRCSNEKQNRKWKTFKSKVWKQLDVTLHMSIWGVGTQESDLYWKAADMKDGCVTDGGDRHQRVGDVGGGERGA